MRTETTPAGRRVIVEEEFTAAHIAGQRDFLLQCLAEAPDSLLLDLGAVESMDGRGVALLAGLAASCSRRSIPLRLTAVRPELQKLLDLCGFTNSMENEETTGDD